MGAKIAILVPLPRQTHYLAGQLAWVYLPLLVELLFFYSDRMKRNLLLLTRSKRGIEVLQNNWKSAKTIS